ncbi:flavoprotein [Colletotrichum scovillei]|uniref:Phosphopantothenoylcysteine decarboxylase n=1 Tax=Colletotrichum scovillei TaxID=1209932 RepID=A0A9P7R0F6_9PEZI|nr:flavoprotein [Colletotrichum scovillei]KAF4776267.1 flavoprotein [Colletotrichum scovillei]KAG7047312.1 phosphopantothenoylcysteine decarboxylase [Colletotrichum scovillei]KAG7059633.1 phosphopantothenoylcysteine decarboxylase [Colletotrichum scovillei]KAG7067078.1 phosphopantothenoylcysteine decarboxylase [Colletotrichum scovillei]
MDPPDPLPLRITRSASSSSSLHFKPRDRKLHLLVAANGPRDISWAQALVVRLSKSSAIEMRAIVDDAVPRLSQTVITMQNRSMTLPLGPSRAGSEADVDDIEFYRQQAFELVEWADLLVLAPIDADNIAKMMVGIADTFLLEVLRGWDTAKKVLLVPGMSTHMWENPVTKRQLNKINSKWPWVRAMPPILWHYDSAHKHPKRIVNWNGFNDVLGIIKNQADLLGLDRDVDVVTHLGYLASGDPRVYSNLPPEIWTIILDFADDWELAQALGIFTNLPMPYPWKLQPRNPNDPVKVYEHELEWLVLTCDSTSICKKLLQSPPTFHELPALVIKLLIRFSLIEVLTWMEANRPDLFQAFDGKVLATKASAYFGRPDVLDYWKESRYFRGRHQQCYDAEVLDGASKNGHIQSLDWWWRRSGLPLRFTEAALEQASGKGHLLVLEWWRDAAAQDENIVLRPGKSLLWAAQHGQVDVIRWWVASGIPVANGDGVAKIASRWGQVGVLELWRKLKGDDKLAFDGEVLVQPTIHQHIGVLEWWRKFAYGELEGMEGRKHRVEYRTCDIEEALEDSIGDQEPVRKWWASNGLNLSIRNLEWMRPRYL